MTARFALNQPVTFAVQGQRFLDEISGVCHEISGPPSYYVLLDVPGGTTETIADEAELTEAGTTRGNRMGAEVAS